MPRPLFQPSQSELARSEAEALALLGLMHIDGQGVARDYSKAKGFLERAARLGSARGMAGLGLLYLNGYGVAPNPAKAYNMAKQAVTRGDALGQFLLGMFYLLGEEVEPSLEQAGKYLGLAAKQGLVQARNMLEKLNCG